MKRNNNKLLFIAWIGIIVLLIFLIVNKPKPEEKPQEEVKVHKKVQEKNINWTERETKEDFFKQEREKTQERYFKEMADWANIGEGEE